LSLSQNLKKQPGTAETGDRKNERNPVRLECLNHQYKETLVMKTITEIIGGAQGLLNISYDLQDVFEEYLTDEYKTFLHIVRVVEGAQNPLVRRYAGTGRIPYQYQPFVRSILAKCFFKIDTAAQFIHRLQTDSNLRLLCGFEHVPGKSTFSRNFAVLSETAVMRETLDRLVKEAHSGQVVYHVSRDSTAIEGREKPRKKPEKPEKVERKRRGRPKKGEIRSAKPETVIERQVHESVEDALKNIDRACAHGRKKNSHGVTRFWTGYKPHLDVSDTGFPLSAFVSGANVHDSQLAIPLEKMTESKVFFCYSLMDAAYDSSVIENFIRSRGRIPIIDPNNRGSESRPPLDPAKKERYKMRTEVERANSILKDWLLPGRLYVKGHTKVSFVLFAAVLCLAALRMIQYFII
jgi:transposase